MNRTVPTTNLSETTAEKDKRRRRGSKLRPIDKDTDYDISGSLRRLIHQIEAGEHGEVTDLILAIRSRETGRIRGKVKTIAVRTSQPEVLHFMAAKLEREFFQ